MEDLYFKNQETRTIFGLVELNGKQQIWYTETKENLRGSTHPKLETALANLEKLYKGMK